MADFDADVQLDTSQVEDRRGSGGGRLGPGGVSVGGLGIVGIIILVLMQVLGGGGGGSLPNLNDLNGTQVGGGADNSNIQQECRTGADADRKEACRIVGFTNSIQKYWAGYFKAQGQQYTQARTVFFSGQVSTQCGVASSAVGPFYCPPDQRVYLDLGFFQELQSKFGAKGGAFAEAYVIAHEYGHHVQNLSGILDKVARDRSTVPQSAAVRVELQADCLAGVWAHHSGKGKDWLDRGDIEEGLNAASRIGDDTLQKASQGRVVPESFTHGSSAQRVSWFRRGLSGGSVSQCNTFEGS